MAKRGENIYKRKDGRYEGRYIVGRKACGKPRFGYIYDYTYSAVKARLTLAKAVASHSESLRTLGDGTAAAFVRYWLENCAAPRVKQSTYVRYCERVDSYIAPHFGEQQLRRIDESQIAAFIKMLEARNLAPSTIAGVARLLKSILAKALELHLLTSNPCANMVLPEEREREIRVLSRSEQAALEAHAANDKSCVRLGVFLSLYTGLRIGEICALRWRDVDFAFGDVHVRRTLQRIKVIDEKNAKTTLLESEPKSKRSRRVVPMPHGLVTMLAEHRAAAERDAYVLSGSTTPLEPRTLRAQFKRVTEKLGVALPFHSLRHTYATRCLENHFDIQALSELLGHSNSAITSKIYAHSVSEHKRGLVSRIDVLSETNKPSNKPSAATKSGKKSEHLQHLREHVSPTM